MKTSPYSLMIIVLKGLGDKSHLENVMHVKRAEFHPKGVTAMETVTVDDFYKECVKILNDVRPMEEIAGFAREASYFSRYS